MAATRLVRERGVDGANVTEILVGMRLGQPVAGRPRTQLLRESSVVKCKPQCRSRLRDARTNGRGLADRVQQHEVMDCAVVSLRRHANSGLRKLSRVRLALVSQDSGARLPFPSI
jgi:hypothetical protein